MKPKVKKGDIFYTSWGYDQTNYDFVVVKKISPSGKTALAQLAKIKDRGYSGQAYIQEPTKKGFGKPFRLKIEEGYREKGEPQLRGSYPFIANQVESDPEEKKGKHSKRLGTLWKHKPKRTYFETDPIFGH